MRVFKMNEEGKEAFIKFVEMVGEKNEKSKFSD